jgi:hypothetical protein
MQILTRPIVMPWGIIIVVTGEQGTTEKKTGVSTSQEPGVLPGVEAARESAPGESQSFEVLRGLLLRVVGDFDRGRDGDLVGDPSLESVIWPSLLPSREACRVVILSVAYFLARRAFSLSLSAG